VRYEILASVELRAGDETLILPARNLSLGGIFLANDGNDLSQLAVGSQVELHVFNAADESSPAVRALAEVVRCDNTGVGLRWHGDPETGRQLTSLLGNIRQDPRRE
jgi:hypothetical protein